MHTDFNKLVDEMYYKYNRKLEKASKTKFKEGRKPITKVAITKIIASNVNEDITLGDFNIKQKKRGRPKRGMLSI